MNAIRQEIHLKQEQTLSPLLQQSLKILAMNNQQLDKFIEGQQLENPVLERGEPAEAAGSDVLFRAQFHAAGRRKNCAAPDDADSCDIPDEQPEALEKYLTEQLPADRLTEKEYRLAVAMIREMDANGYLGAALDEICNATGAGMREAERCLKIIQAMEPAGVGARDLKECLDIQLRLSGRDDPEMERLIRFHLEDVANGHINKIARRMHLPRGRVEAMIDLLKTLNPKPASCFGAGEIHYIVPDVIVRKAGGGLEISLNDRWMRPPVLSGSYLSLSASCKEPELARYLNEKIRQANFILYSIERRKNAVLSLTRMIVNRQHGFFAGDGSLVPLEMRSAAAALGFHESTVSRMVKEKYIQCDRGTFPMRSFFVRKVCEGGPGAGTSVSNFDIKRMISALVRKENQQSPLSDAEISARLQRTGIPVARRTVAKYREELGIRNAFLRRRREG